MVYSRQSRGSPVDSKRKYRARWGYLAASIIVFIIELTTTLYVHDRITGPYIGDTLMVVPVYYLARMFVSVGVKQVPLYVSLSMVCVGTMRYFRLAEILGSRGNAVARTILDSVFDWKDIACYGAGCLLIQIFEIRRRVL